MKTSTLDKLVLPLQVGALICTLSALPLGLTGGYHVAFIAASFAVMFASGANIVIWKLYHRARMENIDLRHERNMARIRAEFNTYLTNATKESK